MTIGSAPCLKVEPHLCPADQKHQRNQDIQKQCRGLEKNITFNKNQTKTIAPTQATNNFKSIQTTSSLLDIKNNTRHSRELRSKSYENVRLNKREMQEEILEWWQMHRDKTKMKKWGEKLQRLAEKLKKPGGEEKLRMKIVKYLKRVPSQLSECDCDRKEFREHLPDIIIRKLKKYYHINEYGECPSPVKVFRLELRNYCDKYSSNKQIIRNWLKCLSIKKRDFLGRVIKLDDILDYIIHQISPMLMSKPDSELEYKYILKSNLMDIMEELPIVTGSNKIHYLNKITDKLIHNLLNYNGSCNAEHAAEDCQLDTARFIVPEEAIKEFVSGEVTNFINKSHICMSTKTMASIEAEMTNILTNRIYYIDNIDESVKDDIDIVLKDIGKLRSYQAKHFSNTLLENLKYFYRHSQDYLQKTDKAKRLTNSTSLTDFPIFRNEMNYKYANIDVVLGQYRKQLINEIDTWLESIQIPLAKEKEFRNIVVRDLADDIVNSYKEVSTQNEIDNKEHLKYHILEWIKKLTGKSNKRIEEYAQNLLQRIANLPNDLINFTKLNLHNIIQEAVIKWTKHLPLKLVQTNDFIGQITREIYTCFVHQEIGKCENNEEKIKSTIFNYLRGVPLKDDQQSELYLNEKISDLWGDLKDIHFNLYRNDKNGVISNISHEHIIPKSSISYVNTNDYLEKLTEQIEEWLSHLNIPQIKDNKYRQVVVNDLAQDIIDRYKYVKINPSSRGTDKVELEHLKYQIFKWINKLVGEENIETIAHASELMQKIRSIPISIFMDDNQNTVNEEDKIQVHVFHQANSVKSTPDYNSGSSRRQSTGKVNELMQLKLNKVKRTIGPEDPNQFLIDRHQQQRQNIVNRSMNHLHKFQPGPTVNKNTKIVMPILTQEKSSDRGPGNQPRPTTPKQYSNVHYNPFEASKIIPRVSDVAEYTELEEGTTLSQIYEQYTKIFKHRCDEIPLATPTPEQEYFVKITRQALFNNIWKTFFQLKSDPEIENDYLCFEYNLEDRLDDMYDCLPETDDVQKYRQTWKAKVVLDAMKMLKKIHSITDSGSFRKLVANKIQRYVIRSNKQLIEKDNINYIILSTADQYVVYKKYQESDPIKANIYKHRLMKYIEEVLREYDNIVKMPLKKFTELQQQLFVELDKVPVPGEDMLEEEVDEIMIGEEIEKWFNELPLYHLESEEPILMRERLRQLLAKKIHEWEKRFDVDEPSIERNMKHDVSVFLGRCGILQKDVHLNINTMVDELANRLRARRQQKELLGYQSFERKEPLSSSLAPLNPNPVLPYLIAAENDRPQDTAASSRQIINANTSPRRQSKAESVHAQQSQLASSQLADRVFTLPESCLPNLIDYEARLKLNDQEIKAYQRPCWTGKLGTSQLPGPSRARNVLPVPIQGHTRPCNQVAYHLPNSNMGKIQEGPSCAQAVITETSQVAQTSHAPNLVEVPIPSQVPYKQITVTSPNGNLSNVQVARSNSVQAVSVEHMASPQPISSQGPTPGQGTRSTARVLESNQLLTQGQRNVDIEEEETAEEPNRCRCLRRLRCNKRRYVCGCDDSESDDDPRYMNVPCRYFY